MAGEFSQFEDDFRQECGIRRHFRRGETVSGMLDSRRECSYYVVSGLVGCSSLDEDGDVHTFAARGAGTIFPLYYSYESTMTERTLEFVALEDTELIVIPREHMRDKLLRDPRLMMAMMNAWGKFATYLVYASESHFESVRTRVCTFLYLHAASHGELRMSHAEIAQVVGSTRESVSRVFCELKRQGVVSVSRCRIRVLDWPALKAETSFMVNSLDCV